MRNVKVLRRLLSPGEGPGDSWNTDPAFAKGGFAVDSASNYAFIVSKNRNVEKKSLSRGAGRASIQVEGCDPIEDVQVVGVEYIAEYESLVFAMTTGDLFSVNTGAGDGLEAVGEFSGGALCMSASPDQDLIVAVTGEGKMMCLTNTADLITEVDLLSEGAQKDATPRCLFQGELKSAQISWRGDGECFAVSLASGDGSDACIYVYSRDFVLENKCEVTSGLLPFISWRPSGAIIASVRRDSTKNNAYEVVFFERNGLRHGEFPLAAASEISRIEGISWNEGSDLLAVTITEPNGTMSASLHHRDNYHWYRKGRVLLRQGPAGGGHCTPSLVWDKEKLMRMHILSEDGTVESRDLVWEYDVTCSGPSIVAVVDSPSVKLTNMSTSLVPPPMFSAKIDVNEGLSEAVVSPLAPETTEVVRGSVLGNSRVAVVTNTNRVDWYEHDPSSNTIVCRGPLPIDAPGELRTARWIAHDSLVVILHNDGKDRIVVVSSIGANPRVRYNAPDVAGLCCVAPNIKTGLVHISTVTPDNKVLILDPETMVVRSHIGFPQSLVQLLGVHTQKLGGSPTEISCGLSENGKLYANSLLLAEDCSSFGVHDAFLVYITSKPTHRVRFLRLESMEDPVKAAALVTSTSTIEAREVEIGSRLVAVMRSEVRLVLQMPRGNLECVSPRATVLWKIKNCLEAQEYKAAFLLARSHRVDLNILYDHDPKSFIENAEIVVRQIGKPDHLNLIFSALRDDNVTFTMFRAAYEQECKGVGGDRYSREKNAGKRNEVCERYRDVMNEVDAPKYTTSLLSTHALQTPPQLEEALGLVRSLRDAEANDQSVVMTAEDALHYLIYLADCNVLYDTAMGMYDFDLVLMVAKHSQKDPKEYLPRIAELQKLPKYILRFQIDDSLQRRDKAFVNLTKAGEEHFDEAIEYMKKHKLYNTALSSYPESSSQWRRIMYEYADYLSTSHREEAGVAYDVCGKHEEALECFKLAAAWRLMFVQAHKLKYEAKQLSQLAHEAVEPLREAGLYSEAAECLMTYCTGQEEKALEILVEGKVWEAATHLAHRSGRVDLIETNVKPGIVEHADSIRAEIERRREQVKKYQTRLLAIRENKRTQPALWGGITGGGLGGEGGDDETMSMKSMTSFASSASSQWSNASSTSSSRGTRRKRKHRYRVKEGSPMEESAIISDLTRLVPTSEWSVEIKALLKAMVSYGMRTAAMELQREYEYFVVLVTDESFFVISGSDGSIDIPGAPASQNQGSSLHAKAHSGTYAKKEAMIIKDYQGVTTMIGLRAGKESGSDEPVAATETPQAPRMETLVRVHQARAADWRANLLPQ